MEVDGSEWFSIWMAIDFLGSSHGCPGKILKNVVKDTSRLDPGKNNTWKTRDIMKVQKGFPSFDYLPTVNQGFRHAPRSMVIGSQLPGTPSSLHQEIRLNRTIILSPLCFWWCQKPQVKIKLKGRSSQFSTLSPFLGDIWRMTHISACPLIVEFVGTAIIEY